LLVRKVTCNELIGTSSRLPLREDWRCAPVSAVCERGSRQAQGEADAEAVFGVLAGQRSSHPSLCVVNSHLQSSTVRCAARAAVF
jgi:hypothetical protein